MFAGTREIDGSTLRLRSAHDDEPGCAKQVGEYQTTFASGWSGVTLTLVSDECGARREALDAFTGAQ